MPRLFTTLLFLLSSLGALDAVAQPRSLTYAEALGLATDRNLGLLIDGMNRELQEIRAEEARRPYVPVIFLQPQFVSTQSTVRTSASVDPEVLRSSRFDASGGARWDMRWGTSLALRAVTTPWFSDFAPTPLTTLEASMNQPLLRNGWGSGNLLEVADLEVELQRTLFVEQLNVLLRQVDGAYWELAYSQADVAIKERSRDRAKSQYEDTRENISRGLLAPGDIFVVEENLVIFEEQLLRSREAVSLAGLRVARLLQLDEAGQLQAADPLDPAGIRLPSTQEALGQALRDSPRIGARRIALKQAKVQLAFDRNQSRPVLDLSATLGLNGLSENYGESWGESLSAENPAVRVGLYFEVPLVSGPYRARVRRADLQRKQEIERLHQVESDVSFDVRELLTQLESRIESLEFSKRRIELATKKLATEQDKYQRGLSTLTDLVRFQRDLDGASVSEQRARLQVVVLQAQLSAAQGVLHTAAGVEVR